MRLYCNLWEGCLERTWNNHGQSIGTPGTDEIRQMYRLVYFISLICY